MTEDIPRDEWNFTASAEHPDGTNVYVSSTAPGGAPRRALADLSELTQLAAYRTIDGYDKARLDAQNVPF